MEVRAFIWSTRGDDVYIDIEADYQHATPDVHYLRNGDPGHPGDAEVVDITSATIDGVDVELDEDEKDRARLAICEAASDHYADEHDRYDED